jgi:hypothetical protein
VAHGDLSADPVQCTLERFEFNNVDFSVPPSVNFFAPFAVEAMGELEMRDVTFVMNGLNNGSLPADFMTPGFGPPPLPALQDQAGIFIGQAIYNGFQISQPSSIFIDNVSISNLAIASGSQDIFVGANAGNTGGSPLLFQTQATVSNLFLSNYLQQGITNALPTTGVTLQFTQPAASTGATHVNIDVVSSTEISVDDVIFIPGGGYYIVTAKPSATEITVYNPGYSGYPGYATPGDPVAVGSSIGTPLNLFECVLPTSRVSIGTRQTESFVNGLVVEAASLGDGGSPSPPLGAVNADVGYSAIVTSGNCTFRDSRIEADGNVGFTPGSAYNAGPEPVTVSFYNTSFNGGKFGFLFDSTQLDTGLNVGFYGCLFNDNVENGVYFLASAGCIVAVDDCTFTNNGTGGGGFPALNCDGSDLADNNGDSISIRGSYFFNNNSGSGHNVQVRLVAYGNLYGIFLGNDCGGAFNSTPACGGVLALEGYGGSGPGALISSGNMMGLETEYNTTSPLYRVSTVNKNTLQNRALLVSAS